ncbi:uncharacterized protein PFL1_03698 [Pseudozyma flocculosa PF-1]|uniref:Uncharacterized protein n=2 Tax=Pseudozyma flocculosa TaxID=84751 RepID=A0A5C3F3V4_9BASI|nr:uncharacterized protein PFL1_03698 [Pseudozyma flocculosa PF-1]EPQ28897.1 hypothetical protein PFL1_03698 [Pseudozyma flocculosa PF-1]SPO38616.1 uncharacterized protein PSFLO_04094 [Pseudozyma flocculosa]
MPLDYLRKVDNQSPQPEAVAARPPAQTSPARAGGISAFKAVSIALVSIVVLPAIIYLPWILALLRPTSNLPDFWVRPSIKLPHAAAGAEAVDVEQLGEPTCLNAHATAVDPYHRSPPYHEWDRKVQATQFCEDAEIVHTHGIVVVSCDPGRAEWNTVMGPLKNVKPRGALWVYDFANVDGSASAPPPADALEIVHLVGFPDRLDFHPLGISILEEDGTAKAAGAGKAASPPLRLFVVNHQRLRSTVEVFDLEKEPRGWVATYVRSIVDPVATHTPNSVQALSRDSFLVTQDHFFARRAAPADQLALTYAQALPLPALASRLVAPLLASIASPRSVSALLAPIETFLGLPLSWVAHVEFDAGQGRIDGVAAPDPDDVAALVQQERSDAETASQGVSSSIIADRIPFANGLALSPKRSTMVVASSTHPGVFLYDLGPPPPPPPSSLAPKQAKKPFKSGRTANIKPKMNWTRRDHVRLREKVHAPYVVDNLSFGPVEAASSSSSSSSSSLLSGAVPGEGDGEGGAKKTSGASAPPRDPFDGAALILAGHPDAFALMRLAKVAGDALRGGRALAPSWAVAMRPSQSYFLGQDKYHLSSLMTNLEHDRDAPVAANRRVLTHDPHWRLVSLLQSSGEYVDFSESSTGARGDEDTAPPTSTTATTITVGLKSSTTAVWNRGFLLVTGLYAKEILVCTNVAREIVAS